MSRCCMAWIRGQELLQRLGSRHRSAADDQLGSEVRGDRRLAQKGVVGADDVREVVWPEAERRERVGQDGVAGGSGEGGDGVRVAAGFGWSADDDAVGSSGNRCSYSREALGETLTPNRDPLRGYPAVEPGEGLSCLLRWNFRGLPVDGCW